MIREDKVLAVRLNGVRIGLLEQTPVGKMRFQYDEGASARLSIGMPIRPEPYDEIQTEAYFGGLLPESDAARKAIARRYGVNANNSFSLLKAIGYDCAGAVSLHALDDTAPQLSVFPLEGRILSEDALARHIQELPQKPLFLGVEGLRLSLAGAQDKAAVCLIDNQVALPEQGCPTTHILKPVAQGFDGLVHNEYLCLQLAERIGLQVPHVEIRWVQDIPYLLIERYDRLIKDQTVRRVHQEDFCQALGIVSANKYQADGGPDLTACFNLLRSTAQPVKDRNALASLVVFNYLVGNMDAHGKNFSLLHRDSQTVTLTPVYDVVCTRAYDELAQRMAMKIGGYYDPDDILPRHWERQCKAIGYAWPAMKTLLKTQGPALLNVFHEERAQMEGDGLMHSILSKMEQLLTKHISMTLNRLNNE
jgi:serine/threonine-protein kinase HipA